MTTLTQEHDDKFSSRWINLADHRLGTEVLYATDDFFAEKEKLILPGRGIFIADKYTDNGKWMDGWESRRKRTPGHDHCIVKLGCTGSIYALDIDTNHFLGNHPPHASVEACLLDEGKSPDDKTQWKEVLSKSALNAGSQNLFEIESGRENRYSHVRLNIFPDGGVARLRVYGEVDVDWSHKEGKEIDLLAVENGGQVISCNDMFFSSKDNLIMPGRGKDMGDGWETKRRRTPGHDWVIAALGHGGTIKKIEVDTANFKGNYPDEMSIDALRLPGNPSADQLLEAQWVPCVGKMKLQAHHQHYFSDEILLQDSITHIRLNIFPDGGISRLRLFGMISGD